MAESAAAYADIRPAAAAEWARVEPEVPYRVSAIVLLALAGLFAVGASISLYGMRHWRLNSLLPTLLGASFSVTAAIGLDLLGCKKPAAPFIESDLLSISPLSSRASNEADGIHPVTPLPSPPTATFGELTSTTLFNSRGVRQERYVCLQDAIMVPKECAPTEEFWHAHIAREYTVRPDPKDCTRRLAKARITAQMQQQAEVENPHWDRNLSEHIEKVSQIQLQPHGTSGLTQELQNGEIYRAELIHGPLPKLPGAGFAASVGRRPLVLNTGMEDSHQADRFCFKAGNESIDVEFMGVFDGHGDAGHCSSYIADQLIFALIKRLEQFNGNGLCQVGIRAALKLAPVDMGRSYSGLGGSTAIFCLVIQDVLWVAGTGDSRGILIKDENEIIQLSIDQKPTDPNCANGVYNRGGRISYTSNAWRVNEWLNMTRALGNHILKGSISGRPKVMYYELPPLAERKNWVFLLICDGLTEVASTRQLGTAVSAMQALGHDPAQIALDLLVVAWQTGSLDNMTALVLNLGTTSTPERPPEGQAPSEPPDPLVFL